MGKKTPKKEDILFFLKNFKDYNRLECLAKELSKHVNYSESTWKNREPQIEIRTKDETLYVKYNEFLYAKALVAGKTTIVLKGRKDTIYYKDISMVRKAITEYPFMIAVNKDTVISTYHIDRVTSFHVHMDDGTSFPISLKMSSALKKIVKNQHI